jgi:proton-translocating NADH-quinone oxidoreductase chain L
MVFDLGTWIVCGSLLIKYKFIIDPLSISFATLVSLITLLILIYSYDYLFYDPNLVKFFAYLNFFAFSMSCLVLGENYVVMFLGWEGVGLASYLLINFWSTRTNANQAALKAIIFNRFGDAFFLAAMGVMYLLFDSFDLEVIALLLPCYDSVSLTIFSQSVNCVELLAFFLFLAAAAKSAQLFMHHWLPDAMEGPTPVSALLHSATMVTAGVFLILRSSLIFSSASKVSFLVACIGLITANISGFTGLFQYDIKRIIAFSTCSQLGYMVYATGVGSYTFAFFHLINHAFFKALLFMCAGSIIHATGEQDIRRMGALFKSLPITYSTMLLASLSLIGFPFFSGFYSKDLLIESTMATFGNLSYIIYFISALSTAVSAFYSFRLVYFVFFGDLNLPRKIVSQVSESSPFLYGPLIVLAILSVFSGYFLQSIMALYMSFYFFEDFPTVVRVFDIDLINDFFKILPTVFSLLGLSAVYFVYCSKERVYNHLYKTYITINVLFCKRFFADSQYNRYLGDLSSKFALSISYKLLDNGLYESMGPEGIYAEINQAIEDTRDIETNTNIYRILLFVGFLLMCLIAAFFGHLPLIFIIFCGMKITPLSGTNKTFL